MQKVNRKKSKKSKQGPDSVETLCGRQLYYTGAINTNTVFNLMPSSFSRALPLADVFQFYRFTMIKVTIYPVGAAAATSITQTVFGFAPGAVFDTPPASITDVVQLPKCAIHGNNKTSNTELIINRKDLLSHTQLPWFKTIIGTEDTQFEIQANLYLFSSIMSSHPYTIEYCIEFQSPNVASNSPMIKIPYPLFQKYSNLLKDANDANVNIDEHGSMLPAVAGQDDFKANSAPLQLASNCVINFDGNLYKRIA